jgi:MFS family permease
MTFAVQGVMALGGVTGGFLAELLGLRPVILICAAGIAMSTIWIWTSPLRPKSPRHSHPTAHITRADTEQTINGLIAAKRRPLI